MKYLEDGPFGTGVNSDAYRDGWERTFGKKTPQCARPDRRVPPAVRPAPVGGAAECTAAPCACRAGCTIVVCHFSAPCPKHGCVHDACWCST